jgi:hypothetical protein
MKEELGRERERDAAGAFAQWHSTSQPSLMVGRCRRVVSQQQ